jgi:hypothetical protein
MKGAIEPSLSRVGRRHDNYAVVSEKRLLLTGAKAKVTRTLKIGAR